MKDRSRRLIRVVVGLLGIVGILGTIALLSGFRWTRPQSEALEISSGPPWDATDALLSQVVSGGRVDYERLEAERDRLDALVATLAVMGPRSTPELFDGEASEFAYYINAYNLLTLFAVMEHMPLESVQDVGHPFVPVDGFGFFYARYYRLDGRWTNLYDLEHRVLRARFDARLHAAINCASVSCPALREGAYFPRRLEDQLAEAAAAFTSTPYVEVDHEARVIELNAIYSWFAEDFAEHSVELGGDESAIGWILLHTTEANADALSHAIEAGYRVHYQDYDWGLNAR